MSNITTPSGPLEILIVDDDRIVSLLHGKVLKNSNIEMEPFFFGDGKEALDFIVEHPEPEISFLVLLDLNMPVMDGWDFLDRCKEIGANRKVFVVVVTSSLNNADLYRALDYKQVVGFSRKPFTLENMQGILEVQAVKDLFLEMEYEALEEGSW